MSIDAAGIQSGDVEILKAAERYTSAIAWDPDGQYLVWAQAIDRKGPRALMIADLNYAAAGGSEQAGLLSLSHLPSGVAAYVSWAPSVDAANCDLKGFTPEYYREMCGGELEPVLESLKIIRAEGVHLELTNLVVPTKNDDPRQIREMCDWIARELGPDTPLHFSRFHPLYKLRSLVPTPVATLEKARETALAAGLRYVYVGNVPGHPAESTWCPGCGRRVIERTGFTVGAVHLEKGKCAFCGRAIPGLWG
jgi:pyruvate formate lyase activating enzyme